MKSIIQKKNKKILAAILVLAALMVGGTLAYLLATDEPLTNTFIPSSVTSEVGESFDDNIKSDVTIKNTGDVRAYIRAAVVITWQDRDGNVYGEAPVAGIKENGEFTEDYIITHGGTDGTLSDSGWSLASDGFYYYTLPVDADAETAKLIDRIESAENRAPEGYYLNVEIIGSAIQADGESQGSEGVGEAGKKPVELAWSSDLVEVTVGENGNLVVTNKQ